MSEKRVVITAGAAGIGLVIAKNYLAEGAKVNHSLVPVFWI